MPFVIDIVYTCSYLYSYLSVLHTDHPVFQHLHFIWRQAVNHGPPVGVHANYYYIKTHVRSVYYISLRTRISTNNVGVVILTIVDCGVCACTCKRSDSQDSLIMLDASKVKHCYYTNHTYAIFS